MNEQKKIMDKIDMKPFMAGLFLGEEVKVKKTGNKKFDSEKKKDFVPGFPLLELLSNYTNQKIILSKKGEEMFLYQRDVFEDNFKKLKSKEKYLIAYNENDEILGCGEIIEDKKKKMLKPILDLGDFLRRENIS